MLSRDLSKEKNDNESVNTHRDNENEEENKKGKREKEVSTRISHCIRYIKVEENTKLSYKGRTDSAIESMQAPPASMLLPVCIWQFSISQVFAVTSEDFCGSAYLASSSFFCPAHLLDSFLDFAV